MGNSVAGLGLDYVFVILLFFSFLNTNKCFYSTRKELCSDCSHGWDSGMSKPAQLDWGESWVN